MDKENLLMNFRLVFDIVEMVYVLTIKDELGVEVVITVPRHDIHPILEHLTNVVRETDRYFPEI